MKLLVCAFRYKKKKNISDLVSKRLGRPRYLLLAHEDIPGLVRYVKRHRPDYILGMGQSKKGRLVRIERTATKTLVVQGKVLVKTSEKLHSNLLLRRALGSRICYNAGTHLCNYTYYRLLEEFSPRMSIAFLHIPKTLGQKKAAIVVKRLIASINHNNIYIKTKSHSLND